MDNLVYIVVACVIVAGIAAAVYTFSKKTKNQKITLIKEWLKFAVVKAEKALGSGTGQLKLRYVYGKAVDTFPFIVKLMTFEQFSDYVKEALAWMEKQFDSNPAIQNYINSTDTTE